MSSYMHALKRTIIVPNYILVMAFNILLIANNQQAVAALSDAKSLISYVVVNGLLMPMPPPN